MIMKCTHVGSKLSQRPDPTPKQFENAALYHGLDLSTYRPR